MAQPIKQLIHSVFDKPDNWKIDLLRNWDTIIGNLNTKVYLEKITDDTLVLGVTDSCWLQELYLLSHVILQVINEKLDRPRIKQLRFKKIGIRPVKKAAYTAPKPRARVQRPLTSKEKQALTNIKDAQLQQALEDFLIRCYQEQE
jgi:flagellar biogenesis protein FliO